MFVAAHQIVGWVVACSLVALLIDPLVNLVERLLPRALSVIVVVITLIAVVVGVVAGLTRELLSSIDDLEEAAPRAAVGLEERYDWAADVDVTTRVTDLVERINESVRSETIDRAFGQRADVPRDRRVDAVPARLWTALRARPAELVRRPGPPPGRAPGRCSSAPGGDASTSSARWPTR